MALDCSWAKRTLFGEAILKNEADEIPFANRMIRMINPLCRLSSDVPLYPHIFE
jgi:hypothetical protein